jgi:hypothetical protein
MYCVQGKFKYQKNIAKFFVTYVMKEAMVRHNGRKTYKKVGNDDKPYALHQRKIRIIEGAMQSAVI